MPRKASASPQPSPSVLDLVPRIGRSLKAERDELKGLLPRLSGPLADAVRENLNASEAGLKALAKLGDTVRDQSDLLAIARRRPG